MIFCLLLLVCRLSWFIPTAVCSRSSPDGSSTMNLCLLLKSSWDRYFEACYSRLLKLNASFTNARLITNQPLFLAFFSLRPKVLLRSKIAPGMTIISILYIHVWVNLRCTDYTTYCFKRWRHCLIHLSIVYWANHKLCLESYSLSVESGVNAISILLESYCKAGPRYSKFVLEISL